MKLGTRAIRSCIFRVDASSTIGTGHVMRCLVLAEELHRQQIGVYFVCKKMQGDLIEFIRSKNYEVGVIEYDECRNDDVNQIDVRKTIELIQDKSSKLNFEWVIVDHYGLDFKWEKEIRSHVKKIMVIDDLANRKHDCEVLLDQNLHENMKQRYKGLVAEGCTELIGPSYALLRREFRGCTQAEKRMEIQGVKRVLVCFGGSDPTNETVKVVEALRVFGDKVQADIVVGTANQHKEEISQMCEKDGNLNFHFSVDNMVELLSHADFAIGAGGTMVWERCAVGLPTIIICVAENQESVAKAVNQRGAAWYIGNSDNTTVKDIEKAIRFFLEDERLCREMRFQAMKLMEDSPHTMNKIVEIIKGEQ